ncbi:AT-hook motif nuclear-localized protein 28 [Salvia miltiorrhiza]|uniref:AT-hook motif nuclear-localized protein 28 n=1 Tax=Salvia miltiorrhiza TaxID=226208 RepID=UPI0025ACAEE2|nr:AT-hook motif nuclear-localized protein 28 [Salvia miltiorrhiza]
MKRELAEDKQEDHNHTTMFSKLHHQTLNANFHNLSSAAASDYAPASQEADSHTPNAAKDDPLAFPQRSDGGTIEVVRRPRGRPPGSKNKPKPPVIITRDVSEPAMSPYVLELPAGVDIVDSTARFCRKRNIGLCLLNGNGAVTNVTLKQPSTTPGATVTFHGRFDILSISATILPPAAAAAAGAVPFALSLAGPQGQVVGGHVVGPLISAGTIYLVAANFSNPSFHRLQPMDHDQEDSGRDGADHDDSPKTTSGGGSGGAPPTSGGASMYSYQPTDVIWAPATRHQPPPY